MALTLPIALTLPPAPTLPPWALGYHFHHPKGTGHPTTATARLNVVYVAPDGGDERGSDPTARIVVQNEWIGRLQFLDEMGEVVVEEPVRLVPGQSAFLDLPFESSGIIVIGGRGQIRGMIIDGGIDNPNIKNKGTLLGTVEVFGSVTRQTQSVLPGTTIPSPHM